MPISIDPKNERVWNYFVKRKTPVTILQTRKALLISHAQAHRALEHFVFCGLADRYQSGNIFFYKLKDQ